MTSARYMARLRAASVHKIEATVRQDAETSAATGKPAGPRWPIPPEVIRVASEIERRFHPHMSARQLDDLIRRKIERDGVGVYGHGLERIYGAACESLIARAREAAGQAPPTGQRTRTERRPARSVPSRESREHSRMRRESAAIAEHRDTRPPGGQMYPTRHGGLMEMWIRGY
jgi:hypothetical protein